MSPRWERVLLACGATGPPLFVLVFRLEEVTAPADYNELRHPVSSFAIGELGWIQVANFLVTGTLLLAFAFGLRSALRAYGAGPWAAVLLGLLAIGLIGSGIFVTDPLNGYPSGTRLLPDDGGRTLHGQLHDAFGIPVFLGLPILCAVVAYRFWRAGRRGWAAYSTVTAVVFLASFALTSIGFAQNETLAPIAGRLQRLTIVIGWAWLTALAVHLLRARSASRASGNGKSNAGCSATPSERTVDPATDGGVLVTCGSERHHDDLPRSAGRGPGGGYDGGRHRR